MTTSERLFRQNRTNLLGGIFTLGRGNVAVNTRDCPSVLTRASLPGIADVDEDNQR